ncbi:MAG: peptidoglycan-binding protein, partial [Clostridia bacterium]|nr:peptidoglycan-binding protein [Clostridia bacterium]
QTYLSRISQSIAGVPAVTVDGVFGPRTEEAVRAVQRLYGLEENGSVGALTWDAIASLYSDLTA